MSEKSKKFGDIAGNGLLIILFAPFVILFGSAIFGIPIMDLPGFGSWFMASLTICGVIAFVTSLIDGIRNRIVPRIWLLIIGAATVLWGSIFLREFNG